MDEVMFVHAEGQGMERERARTEEDRARSEIRRLVSAGAAGACL